MSTFSQFAGGSGTEVGQFLDGFIPQNVGGTHPSDVVTYKGKTYVKCNQFRSFLAASYPDLYALYGDGIGANVVGESKATITTANTGSQYVAGGYCCSYTLNGTPSGKYSTNNGLTWAGSSSFAGATHTSSPTCFGGLGSIFFVCGGGAAEFSTSTDYGATFVTRSLTGGTIMTPMSMAYNGSGTYCLVGRGGSTNNVFTSTDGVTWTARGVAAFSSHQVIWDPGTSKFVAMDNSGFTMSSSDGITWSAAQNPPTGSSGVATSRMFAIGGKIWCMGSTARTIAAKGSNTAFSMYPVYSSSDAGATWADAGFVPYKTPTVGSTASNQHQCFNIGTSEYWFLTSATAYSINRFTVDADGKLASDLMPISGPGASTISIEYDPTTGVFGVDKDSNVYLATKQTGYTVIPPIEGEIMAGGTPYQAFKWIRVK